MRPRAAWHTRVLIERQAGFFRRLVVFVAAVLGLTLAPLAVANADPGDPAPQPATAADAKTAWLAATEQAEALNEQVLQADEAKSTAAAAVDAANVAVTSANDAVTAAQATELGAQSVVESFSGRLDTFANASFRGARIGELASLLTADSADEYLDSVTALDRVAGDTSQLLSDAKSARTTAEAATADVVSKQGAAVAAQAGAVTASDAAVTAQASLTATKAAFDTQVVEYKSLYDQLTEEERQAAIAAEEARREAEAAAAAAAARAARAAQAPAAPAAPAAADDGADAAPAAAAAEQDSSNDSDTADSPSVSAPNSAAQTAVEAALSKVGSRYVYGAAGPSTFDCSGLTSWAWAQAGVTIPRTSADQAGLPSVPLDQLQPGDLVTYYSPVHHVAMYIGGGQVVHASTESKPVYVTTIAGAGPNASGHRVR